MSSRFYFPDILPVDDDVVFTSEAAHHALRVLRLAAGEPVVLFDGAGHERAARLEVRGKQAVAVGGVWQAVDRESPAEITLVQALVSADKMDWVIQKAVELGAARIIPALTERSVLRLTGERAEKKLAHWRQIVVSACEQCGRNRLPAVSPVVGLATYLARAERAVRLILSPDGERLSRLGLQPGAVHLLVGPEGGWSEGELSLCAQSGKKISLGPRILRTETAGLAAIAALQLALGDF